MQSTAPADWELEGTRGPEAMRCGMRKWREMDVEEGLVSMFYEE